MTGCLLQPQTCQWTKEHGSFMHFGSSSTPAAAQGLAPLHLIEYGPVG